MKKIFLTLLMAGAALAATAQTTREVKGAVIDKNGNPLAGAKIEATGGAESTVTDADGSFSLEVSRWLKSLTATYPGMERKKKSLRNQSGDVVLRMREKQSHWFLQAVGAYDFENYEATSIGLRGGRLDKWGFYGKLVYDVSVGHYDEVESNGWSVSVGLIKRITPKLYYYLGAGVTRGYGYDWYIADSYSYTTSSGYTYYSNAYASRGTEEVGGIAETGLLFSYKHFNVSLGVEGRFADDNAGGIQLGLGYTF